MAHPHVQNLVFFAIVAYFLLEFPSWGLVLAFWASILSFGLFGFHFGNERLGGACDECCQWCGHGCHPRKIEGVWRNEKGV